MGVIKCNKHGISGMIEVCIHLLEGLETTWVAFPSFPGTTLARVCTHCAKKSNLSELDYLKDLTFEDQMNMSEDAFEKQLEIIGRIQSQIPSKSICIQCYNELQVAHHRRLGLSDPFQVYDNTLVYEDTPKINQLESYLKSHFPLPKFQESFYYHNRPDKYALLISPGNIKKPMSIDFYYVVEQAQQQELLQLIEAFFEGIDKKQRKVRFYEKEEVIHEVLPNGGQSRQRGEETVLLELTIE